MQRHSCTSAVRICAVTPGLCGCQQPGSSRVCSEALLADGAQRCLGLGPSESMHVQGAANAVTLLSAATTTPADSQLS